MQLPTPKDARHKDWLYRVLSNFYDDPFLARVLYFKGGTCAAMLGLIDRFSVDLDFDLVGDKSDLIEAQERMEKIFRKLKLKIKDRSQRVPQYFLGYPAKVNERSTLKIDVSFSLDSVSPANEYSAKRFLEIDRIITCQTSETMFANKLVALIGRYKQKKFIAGRDVYDIHQFFENGLRYKEDVIIERTGKSIENFFQELIDFTKEKVADEFIDQDLNMLLPNDKFQMMRKILKQETLMMLKDELARIKNGKL